MSAALKIGSNDIDVSHVVSCYALTFAASREEKTSSTACRRKYSSPYHHRSIMC